MYGKVFHPATYNLHSTPFTVLDGCIYYFFKKQILAKMPFSSCVSMDKIFLMNKNTLNLLNPEDKNNTTSRYNSQAHKYKDSSRLHLCCKPIVILPQSTDLHQDEASMAQAQYPYSCAGSQAMTSHFVAESKRVFGSRSYQAHVSPVQ